MRKTLFALALLCSPESMAKEWTWTAYNVAGGKSEVVANGVTCNYQTAISAGRKAAEGILEGAFMIRGKDNEETCPKQVVKK